jgi:hypothetical protein
MRQYRDTPYSVDHDRSVRRKAQPPKNLLGWFLEAFRAEIPSRIHSADVWRDRVSPDEERQGIQAVGGSLLGSPRTNDAFRRYIEESPFVTEVGEYEGHKDPRTHYSFPLRAALATLSGRGRDTDDYPFMARTLYRTALRDGDWDGACASMGICEPVRKVYIEEALRRLWTKYEVEPPARTIRTSEAA